MTRRVIAGILALAIVMLGPLLAAGCRNTNPGGNTHVASPGNPIGLMLGGGGMGLTQRVSLAGRLGAAYFRPWDITVEGWGGRQADTEAFANAGFGIILTVRNNGVGGPPASPTTPPSDIESYKKTLSEILGTYRPSLLCIENEENSSMFYSGTPTQYGEELRAAAEVAHAKGIKVTNGGMVSTLVAALVWDDYRSRGEGEIADEFLRRAADPETLALLETPEGASLRDEQITKGKQLLEVYRTAGIDFVNFHWYIRDTRALDEAVGFLGRSTGLEPVTNEIGQHDTDPQTVRNLLSKVVELRMPFAVWYSLDRAKARALQDPDGTLRPNGEAFEEFMREKFPS